jgi:hypothetical protein
MAATGRHVEKTQSNINFARMSARMFHPPHSSRRGSVSNVLLRRLMKHPSRDAGWTAATDLVLSSRLTLAPPAAGSNSAGGSQVSTESLLLLCYAVRWLTGIGAKSNHNPSMLGGGSMRRKVGSLSKTFGRGSIIPLYKTNFSGIGAENQLFTEK